MYWFVLIGGVFQLETMLRRSQAVVEELREQVEGLRGEIGKVRGEKEKVEGEVDKVGIELAMILTRVHEHTL